MPVSIDVEMLIDLILEAFRMHSSPTYDRGDAHGDRGQSGMIVWKSSHPFIREAIKAALGASIRGTHDSRPC
jgi:hypothetical protein